MAIAFDAAIMQSIENATVSSYTFAHTVGTLTNGLLIVVIHSRDASAAPGDQVVTGVTYNSVAMTKAREDIFDAITTRVGISIWYLVNPDAGSNTIQVTFTGTVDRSFGGAISLSGVAQSSPIDGTATNGEAASISTSLAATVTTTVDNDWIVNAIYSGSNAGVVEDAATTARWNQIASADSQAASTSSRGTAGNFTETWTGSVADFATMTMVSIKPFVAAASTKGFMTTNAGFWGP